MLPPLSQLSRRSQDQSVQLSVRSSVKASKSLKKLQLDEPRTLPEKSSPSRNQMRVAKSVKSLPKYVTHQHRMGIDEQNTVAKLTIQNDLLRNRLKILSQQMDDIIKQEASSQKV